MADLLAVARRSGHVIGRAVEVEYPEGWQGGWTIQAVIAAEDRPYRMVVVAPGREVHGAAPECVRGVEDALCSLWIDRAPRFGSVAAHFPRLCQRFVASFWAPEVLLFGWWYLGLGMGRHHGHRGGVLCGNTRAGLDIGFSGAIEIAGEPCHPGCTPSRKHLPFWSPELPEVDVRGGVEDPGGFVNVRTFSLRDWSVNGISGRCFLPVLFSLLLLCLSLPASAQTMFGTVSRVVDGDTLIVGKAKIRLHGIDAPEGSQTCTSPAGKLYRCGDTAEAFLAGLAPPGSSISCKIMDTDRYGRLVARCEVLGRDLSQWMVRAGWAVAFRRYSLQYVTQEDESRLAKRGMWAGRFVHPAEWRGGVR